MNVLIRHYHATLTVVAIALLATACSGVAETLNVASAPDSGNEKKVTLQYRVAADAFAPSRFVGVVGDRITPGLSLVWQLPLRLIEMLEARQINGVEFECRGKLDYFVLHATTVPRLTDMGVRQVEDAGY